MKKSLFTAFAVGLCMTANVMAQVPSYVPTNGLVGWWPFNGNANDESGNGNNGSFTGSSCNACGTSTVTAPPISSTDRFGLTNTCYEFTNQLDLISVPNNTSLQVTSTYSFSFWLFPTSFNFGNYSWGVVFAKWGNGGSASYQVRVNNSGKILFDTHNGTSTSTTISNNSLTLNNWNYITIIQTNSLISLKINGINDILNNNVVIPMVANNSLEIGRNYNQFSNYPNEGFIGKIDDIGFWNRALSECEIQDLYNAQLNSVVGTTISVSPQSANIGSNVALSTSSQSTNIQWQSNPLNFGWQNVPNNANYSGETTNTLTVSNVQLSNHNQPFRVIASSGNCTDTSNVATIQIADTCITTVYDTVLTTVTDTLVINTTLSLPAPNNENTILIYPNPASDHITINNGNYSAMAGYTIRIENNAGQQVFQSSINQQQFYVDLSTWSGNGLYFVHLIDPQNNTVTVRKIVLQ